MESGVALGGIRIGWGGDLGVIVGGGVGGVGGVDAGVTWRGLVT